MLSAALTAMVGLAMLAGCDDNGGTAGGRPTETPGTTAPTSPGSPSAPLPTGERLIEYQRTGGLAGVDDRFTVLDSGRYQLAVRNSPTRTGELKPEEVAELRRVIKTARLGAHSQPSATGGVADGFHYTLTVGGRSLRVTDGSIPEDVEPVVSALTALVSQYSQ
ncbi:hypothetical protein GCM10010123_14520 [Pilimelia anulata]|uniref:Uncharacterized protein n=1 Tax=Pilimelia anulata TaxID=53371 RepID=A0A8J3B8P4_9ACTN|nr:hypothetical protein GCM10010123_14520 [Pilimelia anulata]